MYIETERLIIRSLESADEQAYVKIASDGSLDEDIFSGWEGNYQEWMGEWIKESRELEIMDNPKKDYLAYAVVEKDTGIVVGSVGCTYYKNLDEVGQVYFVGADHRGKGYATEMAAAYTEYFLTHYDIPKMIILIRAENIASNMVAVKAGFILTETKLYQDDFDVIEKLYNFYEIRKPH